VIEIVGVCEGVGVTDVDGVSEIVGVTDAEGVTDIDCVTDGVGEEETDGTGITYGCDMSQQNLFVVLKFVLRYRAQP
jgi:hypothetical protein